MVKAGLKRKNAELVCCLLLILMCTALPLNVRAAEEKGASSPVSVKVYSEMSDRSRVTANLIEGNTFKVLETARDDEGETWYHIKTDFGAEGYVRADEVNRLKVEKQVLQKETQETIEDLETGDADENAFDEKTFSETVSDEETLEKDVADVKKNEESNGEIITLAVVNLRSMPSAGSKMVDKIAQGVRLTYVQKLVNDAGESWYKVEYDGTEGYVIAKAVRLVKEEQQPKEEKPISGEEEAEERSETETLSEEVWQEEPKPESQIVDTADTIPFAFEVEDVDVQQERKHKRIDLVLIMLAIAGTFCIGAIVVFLIKIWKLRRN